jgi:hypothetical protein
MAAELEEKQTPRKRQRKNEASNIKLGDFSLTVADPRWISRIFHNSKKYVEITLHYHVSDGIQPKYNPPSNTTEETTLIKVPPRQTIIRRVILDYIETFEEFLACGIEAGFIVSPLLDFDTPLLDFAKKEFTITKDVEVYNTVYAERLSAVKKDVLKRINDMYIYFLEQEIDRCK